MITLEQIREEHPEFNDFPDKQLEEIRDNLYTLANIALDSYFDDKLKKL